MTIDGPVWEDPLDVARHHALRRDGFGTVLRVRHRREPSRCAGGGPAQGRAVFRLSLSNWSTTEDDVDRALAALRRAPG